MNRNDKLRIITSEHQPLPLYTSRVSAGFLSPAEEHIDKDLDLHEYLVQHPAATFFVRVDGDSMVGAGINTGDLLIVDRSLEVVGGRVVIAAVDGELTVKRLVKRDTKYFLVAENKNYPEVQITDEIATVIWGVVVYVIHAL
jgi:DNA polymerase V